MTAADRNNALLITNQTAEIRQLRDDLAAIEKVCWREGEQFKERLVECRRIARAALDRESPTNQ